MTQSFDAAFITSAQVDSKILEFLGEIDQVPSSVSAIKVDGKRAYDLVREGKIFELKSRRVTISKFERLSELRVAGALAEVDVLVDCSSGTYIRALARDLGAKLGVGGHLSALRRTRVGNYDVQNASLLSGEIKLLDLTESARLLYPELEIDAQSEIDLRHGKRIPSGPLGTVCAVNLSGALVAILEKSGSDYKSIVVFPDEKNA